MPSFSERSRKELETCDPKLQSVFNVVIQEIDCTIIQGHRGEDEQNELFRTGKSKLQYPNGKHNSNPSKAVDVMIYPIDWEDTERMALFIGYVLGTAKQMGITLRSGADWNMNWDTKDHSFLDYPHFEIF